MIWTQKTCRVLLKQTCRISHKHPNKLADFLWYGPRKTCRIFPVNTKKTCRFSGGPPEKLAELLFLGCADFSAEFLKTCDFWVSDFLVRFFLRAKWWAFYKTKPLFLGTRKIRRGNSDTQNGCPRRLADIFFEMGSTVACCHNMHNAMPDKPWCSPAFGSQQEAALVPDQCELESYVFLRFQDILN